MEPYEEMEQAQQKGKTIRSCCCNNRCSGNR